MLAGVESQVTSLTQQLEAVRGEMARIDGAGDALPHFEAEAPPRSEVAGEPLAVSPASARVAAALEEHGAQQSPRALPRAVEALQPADRAEVPPLEKTAAVNTAAVAGYNAASLSSQSLVLLETLVENEHPPEHLNLVRASLIRIETKLRKEGGALPADWFTYYPQHNLLFRLKQIRGGGDQRRLQDALLKRGCVSVMESNFVATTDVVILACWLDMADWDETSAQARFLEVVVSCVDEGNQSQTHRAAQLFKTQMCPHSAEACRKGASCLFAHTANELRPLPERAHAGEARETTPEAPRPAGRAALVYRTKMCPSGADCLKGRNCKFAHSAADLRPLAHAAAARENDERPPPRTVAAAVNDRPARPDAATWAVMTMTERAVVLFKTQMCPYLASCHYGSRCSFAHSNDELRPPRGNEVRAATTAPPTTAPPTTAAAAPPTTTAAPPARDGGGVAAKDRVSAAAATTKPDRAVTTKPDRAALLYKTQMCPYADKSCHNGSGCKFAHSSTELRPPPARQPPGKEAPPPTTAPRDGAATQLEADCEALVHSHGAKLKNIGTAKMCPFKDGCHWGSDCGFAHSAAELRPPPGKEAHAAAPAPHSATSAASATTASSDGPAAAAALRTKTKICFAFAAGSCKMKGKCKFAHSEAELRPPSATAGEKTDDAAQAPAETPAHAPAAAPAQAPAAPAAPPASAAAPIGASGATGPASVFEDDWAEDGASTPADEADDRDEAEHRATADAASARQNVGLFKTVMCRMVGTKRGCPRGGGCMFAHSRNEIRVAADKAEADEAATPVVGDAAAATADAGDEAVVDEAVVDEAVVDEAVVDLVDEAVVDLGEYEEEGVENDASPVANAAAQTDDADDAVAPKKQGGDEGVDAPDDDSDEVVGGDAGDGDAGTTDGDEVVPPEACEAPLRLVSPAALRCDDDDVSSCGRSFDTTGSEGTVSSLSTGDAAMPRECLAQDGRGSPVSAGDYAEAKECRGRTVLEYSEIPSNAGWKATINARTIIIGTDPGRVRYRESEVVSTSGAKFVVHRPDVPQMKHKGSIRAAASRADSGQKSPTKAP